jgi:hypothetical protein
MICMEHTAKLDRTIVTSGALSLLLIQQLLRRIAATSGLFPCYSLMEISSIDQSPSISLIVLFTRRTKEVSMGLGILPLLFSKLLFVGFSVLLPILTYTHLASRLQAVFGSFFRVEVLSRGNQNPLTSGTALHPFREGLFFSRWFSARSVDTFFADSIPPIFTLLLTMEMFIVSRIHIQTQAALLFGDILRYTIRHSTRSNVVLSASGCYPLRWYQHRFSIAGAKNIFRHPYYNIIPLLQQGKEGFFANRC